MMDITEPLMRQHDTRSIERRLLDEVITPISKVGPEDRERDLIELGLDSMALVHVLAQSEDIFDVELPPVELWDDTDVGISVALIAEKIAATLDAAQCDGEREGIA